MIFFTADHHFDHFNIIRYCGRPFVGVNEMNEELVRRWNDSVSSGDTVYHLGDFSMDKRPIAFFGRRLNGEKHLIVGNHDRWHPRKQNHAAVELLYREAGFVSLAVEMIMQIAGQDVLLNHFPYLSEQPTPGYKLKHQDLRPKDCGHWLLHGHVHEKWKVNGRMINVGVDVWDFRPVPIMEIERTMAGK